MKELEAAITTFLSEAFEGGMEKLVESQNESESQAIKDKTERVKREIQRILYSAFRIAVDMNLSKSLKVIGDQMKKHGLLKNLDNEEGSQISEIPLLQLVVDTNDLKTVGMLLDVGADIDEVMKGPDDTNYRSSTYTAIGTTALHRAACNNQIEIVQLLLDKGASSTTYDSSWLIPIDYAVQMGHLEIVKLLYERGAPIVGIDPNVDATSMTHAVRWNQVHIVRFLSEVASGLSRNKRDAVIGDALYDAASARDIEMMKILLDAGAGVDYYYTVDEESSLHLAARYGYREVAEILLKYNASLRCANKKEDTPFLVAVKQDQREIVELLLTHGAEINETDREGKPPIHLAVEARNTDMMELLLSYGAYIDEGDGNNKTPLVVAAEKNYIMETKLLLRWMVFDNVDYWEENLLLINSKPELKSYQDECQKEMESIKEEIIPETTMRYYDIVRIKLHSKRVYLTRNEIIVKAFGSDNLSSKFPIFASKLSQFFESAIARRKLHDQARRNFCALYDKNDVKHPILPEEFTDRVFDCLRNEALNAFCNAGIKQS